MIVTHAKHHLSLIVHLNANVMINIYELDLLKKM